MAFYEWKLEDIAQQDESHSNYTTSLKPRHLNGGINYVLVMVNLYKFEIINRILLVLSITSIMIFFPWISQQN